MSDYDKNYGLYPSSRKLYHSMLVDEEELHVEFDRPTRLYGRSKFSPGKPEDSTKCIVEIHKPLHLVCQCKAPRGHGPTGEYCYWHWFYMQKGREYFVPVPKRVHYSWDVSIKNTTTAYRRMRWSYSRMRHLNRKKNNG